MRKIAALLICGGLLIGLVLYMMSDSDKEPAEIDNTESTESVVASDDMDSIEEPLNYKLGEFDDALIAYLCLNGYDSSDFLISPTSFRAALCLTAIGAQGNTRTELVKAAGFSGMESLNLWYSYLKKSEAYFADDLVAQNKSAEENGLPLGDRAFSVANSVWSNKDLLGDFTDAYTSNVNVNYDADVYSDKSDELTQAINDWINQKTDGMIPTAVDDVSGASAVLVSTLYLRTAWKNAFSEAATYEGVFVSVDGKEQIMDFMEQTGEYLYVEENGTKVLVVPMEGNMSFVCFLGNRTDRFDKMTNIQTEKVHVVLPKFELASVFDARDLLGFLLQNGVNDAINSQTANFYNMCNGDGWFIQEIIQKTRIKIDEEGIETIAGTNNKEDTTESAEDVEVKEFIADRPFSFAIFSDFGTEKQHMLLYGQLMNGD